MAAGLKTVYRAYSGNHQAPSFEGRSRALSVEFTADELQQFRDDFEAIELAGVRSFESALEDQ